MESDTDTPRSPLTSHRSIEQHPLLSRAVTSPLPSLKADMTSVQTSSSAPLSTSPRPVTRTGSRRDLMIEPVDSRSTPTSSRPDGPWLDVAWFRRPVTVVCNWKLLLLLFVMSGNWLLQRTVFLPQLQATGGWPLASAISDGLSALSALLLYAFRFVNPGVVIAQSCGLDKPAWCSTCKVTRPARAHHCSVCNCCVLLMDHHCDMLSGCVGMFNYRFWIASILLAHVLVLHSHAVSVALVHAHWQGRGPTIARPLVNLFAFFLYPLLSLPTTLLIIYHGAIICLGITTHEQMKKTFARSPNPYCKGSFLGNFKAFVRGNREPTLSTLRVNHAMAWLSGPSDIASEDENF